MGRHDFHILAIRHFCSGCIWRLLSAVAEGISDSIAGYRELVFYGYGQPELLPLLSVAVLGTYLFLVLALQNRSLWLPVGIAFNLALLAFFKYKFLFLARAAPAPTGDAPSISC